MRQHPLHIKTNTLYVVLGFFILAFMGIELDTWQARGAITVESDSWQPMYTARTLYETGAWYNHHIDRLNPPHGIEFHWTRAVDVLLLALAVPLTAVMPFDQALFVGGLFYNVLLLYASLRALFFLLSRMEPHYPYLAFAGLAYVVLYQMAALQGYRLLRVDHHSVQTTCLIFLLCALVKALDQPETRRYAIAAGCVSFFGLWVTVEFFLPYFMVLALLGLAWLVNTGRVEKVMREMAWVCFALSIPGLMAHRPPAEWLDVGFSTFSITHVLLLGAAAITAEILYRASASVVGLQRRFLLAGGVVAVLLAVLIVAIPQVFESPLADLTPFYMQSVGGNVSEFKSLFSVKDNTGGIVLFIIAIAGGVLIWRKNLYGNIAASLLMGGTAVVMGLLPFHLLRWEYYSLLAAAPAILVAVHHAASRLARTWPMQGGAMLLLLTVPLWCDVAAGLLVHEPAVNAEDKPVKNSKECHLEIKRIVQQDRISLHTGGRPVNVITDLEVGFDMFYWTPHTALGAYMHLGVDGVRATYRFVWAKDEAVARQVAKDSQVGMVVLCPGKLGNFLEDVPGVSENQPFLKALEQGRVPAWLRPVPDAEAAAKGVLWFEVVKP